MFCLLRWCMNLPLHQLTKKDENGKCVIGKVLKVSKYLSSQHIFRFHFYEQFYCKLFCVSDGIKSIQSINRGMSQVSPRRIHSLWSCTPVIGFFLNPIFYKSITANSIHYKGSANNNEFLFFQILEVISAGVDKTTPYNNPGLSQEYDLESMMSVAVCTNSPVKSLNRTDAFDQSAYEQTSVSSAAKFVSSGLFAFCPFPVMICEQLLCGRILVSLSG